jgi:peroxiredoxin
MRIAEESQRTLQVNINPWLDWMTHMLKIGSKAPNFRLESDEGKAISLSDFRGQRVLLFFYPKANTSG